MNGLYRCGIGAALLALAPLLAAPLQAQTTGATGAPVTISLADFAAEELQMEAILALEAGEFDLAQLLASALVARDGGDPVGRGILARLALMAGAPAEARDQAVALWRSNPDPGVRYDAARLAAFSWTEMGWPTMGQYWLRRALTVAPDEAATAQTVADFRLVRANNPLSLDFSVSVSPSSNINGGTNVGEIKIGGDTLGFYFGEYFFPLAPSPIDRAYSGLSYAPSLSLGYRLAESESSRTSAFAMLQYRGVVLSDRARRALDGQKFNGAQISDRHFSSAQALAGLEQQWRFSQGDLAVSGHVGRSWARGEPSLDLASLGATYTHYLSETSAVNIGLTRDWRRDVEGISPDEARNTLRLGQVQILPDGGRLRGLVSVTEAISADARAGFTRWSLDLSYRPAEIWEGIGLEARAGYSKIHYPDYEFFEPVPGGRSDATTYLAADLQLHRYSYAGFSPVITLDARQTTSNINQFAFDEVSLNIGFESSF